MANKHPNTSGIAQGLQVDPVYRVPSNAFKRGNKTAVAGNLTPGANKLRMLALFRGWQTQYEDKPRMSKEKRKKLQTRRRVRLRLTVAKEQREIQVQARQRAEAALERISEIAEKSANESAALQACGMILERAYGKAGQTNTNVNIDANGGPQDITDKELNSRIEAAIKRVEELTGGKIKTPPRQERLVDVREHDRDPDSSTRH